MEQDLRFLLDLGGLALNTEKNIWADYKQLLRLGFLCFRGETN